MQTIKNLAVFFICNIIGFFLPLTLYPLSVKLGIIDLKAEDFDFERFFVDVVELPNVGSVPTPAMISYPLLTWAVCGLFSFAYFFVAKRWKKVFLLAPLIMPFLHSLIILLQFV